MSDQCSFNTVRTENITFCPNEEMVGGTKAKMFYLPMAQLQTVTKPTVNVDTPFSERIKLTALTPASDKGFKEIDLVVDENEIKSNLVGTKGNLKDQAQLDVMLPNLTPKNQGFVKTHKNTPMCVVIQDSTDRYWVLLDAYFTKADTTSAKKYDENSGIAINITSNGPLWTYEGSITVLADEEENSGT